LKSFTAVMASAFVAAVLSLTLTVPTLSAQSTTSATILYPLESDNYEIVFGPQTFTRARGAPQTFIETFEHCGTAPCRVVVTNGREDGTGRLSSASIVLNGEQVVGPSDFNQKVHKIVKPAILAEDNELTVTLASNPGGFVTVVVECATPVDLTIGTPGADAPDTATLYAAVGISNDGAAPAENVVITSIELCGGTLG